MKKARKAYCVGQVAVRTVKVRGSLLCMHEGLFKSREGKKPEIFEMGETLADRRVRRFRVISLKNTNMNRNIRCINESGIPDTSAIFLDVLDEISRPAFALVRGRTRSFA